MHLLTRNGMVGRIRIFLLHNLLLHSANCKDKQMLVKIVASRYMGKLLSTWSIGTRELLRLRFTNSDGDMASRSR